MRASAAAWGAGGVILPAWAVEASEGLVGACEGTVGATVEAGDAWVVVANWVVEVGGFVEVVGETELVVVAGSELVDGITDSDDDSDGRVGGNKINEVDGDNKVSVVVVLGSIVVDVVEIDVVVVSSGCVVEVLNDVCEGCVVSGSLNGGSLLVVVVLSHTGIVVDGGSVGTTWVADA